MEKLPILQTKAECHALSNSLNSASERMKAAKQGASILLGCYRVGEANDPETYISAAVAILARYPLDIIREVSGIGGLPSKSKWLPSISEIRDECERLSEKQRGMEDRARQLREQFILREKLESREKKNLVGYQGSQEQK